MWRPNIYNGTVTGRRTLMVTVGWIRIQLQADLTIELPSLERLDHAAQLPVQATAFLTRGAGVMGARATTAPKVVVTVVITVVVGKGLNAARIFWAGG